MKLTRLLEIILREDRHSVSPVERNVLLYGGLFFAAVSAALTALNIQKQYWFMAGTTGILVAGFLAAALLGFTSHLTASRIVTAIMCGIVFSVYAVTGENEGFAILWILLVPIISMSLVGLRVGLLLSAYFQLFLVALFYTPLVRVVQQYYSATFLIRFPLLYFASFGACTILVCEKQDLYDKVHEQAYYDGLTRLYNRAYYIEYAAKAEAFPDLTVVSMDLNGLKLANDTLGHEAGDRLICEAADMIKTVFSGGACFRTGGDEFAVIGNDSAILRKVEAFRHACPNVSVGFAARKDHPAASFAELSREADRLMYVDKAAYRKLHGTRNDRLV